MAFDALTLHYAMLSLQKEVQDICDANGIHLEHFGMQHEVQDLDEWAVFWPLWDDDHNTRRGSLCQEITFQLACHAKLAKMHSENDANAPFRLAATLHGAVRNLRFEVKKYDQAVHEVLCGGRVDGGQQRYVPYRNLTFAGEGNFAVEQGTNTHSVVVTFTALLGVGG